MATPVTRMIDSYENPSSWLTRIASKSRMMPDRALCITRKHALAYTRAHAPKRFSRNEYAETLVARR